MRITETVEHAADPRRVFTMLCDPAYQEMRRERSGALDQTVDVEVDAATGDTVVTTQRHLPSDQLPDFARALTGPQLLVVETVRWGAADADGEREGAMSIDLPGTPVHFLGGIYLRRSAGSAGQHTDHVVEGDLEANIPILGKKIEAAIAPQIRETVRREQQIAQEWLASH